MDILNQPKGFVLDQDKGYFQNAGVSVMAFSDFYAAGHQSGVSILMHGHRVATNGDVRFEQTPGQWQPLPKQQERVMEGNTVSTTMHYPDMEQHLRGFNPMIYPDYEFSYTVRVTGEENAVVVTVDLDKPIPAEYAGKMCFNLELFPGELFGRPWIMDDQQGLFPTQPNGPTMDIRSNYEKTTTLAPKEGITANRAYLAGEGKGYNPMTADGLIALPYAEGHRFTVRPDDPLVRFTVESKGAPLKLYDGRMNHNNGWFVLSSEIPQGVAEGAVQWVITPNVVPEWRYTPVVQTSQVGYLPNQPKLAVIELDSRDEARETVTLHRIDADGPVPVITGEGKAWGRFLRYEYLTFDFSTVKEPGLYQVRYGQSVSSVFRIGADVFDRGVWQPVLEYFLPVQMCHMRVSEKYRVWHGLCHNDDALMAPVNWNHFDGYLQGPSTLCKYQPGDKVPGLNVGGWHDAGDFDLRIESQAGESYILSLIYEAFHVDYDATAIDQATKTVEIHQPDGKNDLLQQIEHGALSVMAGYKALGRLYRGIICNDLRQYVLLGDPANMTDGIAGNGDDRWVFTEDNPPRELSTAAQLAAIARTMKDFNPELSADALKAARELFEVTDHQRNEWAQAMAIHAAVELLITTGEAQYRQYVLEHQNLVISNIKRLGWIAAKGLEAINDASFTEAVRAALVTEKAEIDQMCQETPYGIPYRPHIWGAGWQIQRMAMEYYYLHKAFPEVFGPELILNSLNFVLGCHPGSNTASFASGVGAVSATTAYGMNRADASFIPGGVISGTALIRPDFPELLTWPYLWQQTEYVLGGGSSCYMFLVLAARQLMGE